MHKYIYNVNWLFAEKAVRIAGGLFIGIWVARYLGPKDFGIISYSLAFIAFFSWMSHLGLQQILVREITKYPEKTNDLLGSAFFMKLLGAGIAVLSIAATVAFVQPEDKVIQLCVIIFSLGYVFQSFDVIDCLHQAKVLSKYSAIPRVIALVTILLTKIVMILFYFPLIYFVIAGVADFFIVSLLYIFFYTKYFGSIYSWHFDFSLSKKLFTYSWPLMLSVFLISIHMKLDQVMIGNMMSMSDVGIYSVAVRLSELWYFIPVLIVSTLMPYFISLREKDEKLYQLRLIQLLSFMFWINFLIALGMIFIGRTMIVMLFGIEYEGAYQALVYNIWGGIFMSQGIVGGIWMIAENKQLYRLYIQIIAVVANISMNWFLIPLWGIEGAAIATIVTLMITNWVLIFVFKNTREVGVMIIKSISPLCIFTFLKNHMKGRRLV